MIKTGAVPALLLGFAALASASIAAAEAPAPKPAKPAAPKPTPSGAPTPKAAAAPAAPSIPTPSKELEAFMKGFEGNWKCETKFAAGSIDPAAPEAKTSSAVKIKKEFGGFSWHGEYKLEKTDAIPAMSGVFQVSYDPGTKQATFVSYDSTGAAMLGAGPISSESVTFTEEGYMLGIKAKVRETMTKKSSKAIHHSVEIDQGKGFHLMAEDTCKK